MEQYKHLTVHQLKSALHVMVLVLVHVVMAINKFLVPSAWDHWSVLSARELENTNVQNVKDRALVRNVMEMAG